MSRSLLYLILWLMAILTVSSCSDDDTRGGGTAESGLRDVTFTLSLSGETGGGGAATRALTEDEEVKVEDIHVLGFVDDDNDGTYTYTYRAKGQIISYTNGEVKFTISLREYDFNQRFVVLTNCGTYVDLQKLDDYKNHDDLDEFLPKLLVRSDVEWKAHNTDPSDPMDYIPMYAISIPMLIDQDTKDIGGGNDKLLLIRMLARLDVSVQEAVTNFQLVSAEIFNRKNMGRLAYTDANWDADGKKVTVADMPVLESGFTTSKMPGVVYPADATGAVTRAVYTFETEGADLKNDATALVVGGYYGYPPNQADTVYYRIDIPEFDDDDKEIPGTFGDILRNHRYNIQIKSVSQKGAQTPEDAFDGIVWVEASIVPWNLADMDNVEFKQYGLKVNKSQFIARKSGAADQTLTIFTDYIDGWEATFVGGTTPSWVEITSPTEPWQGSGNETGTIKFNILENNTQEVGRHAVLRVRAGGLTKYVDIFQADDITGDIFPWDKGEHDPNTPLGGYSLIVSRSACRYAGDFGGEDITMHRTIGITATGGGQWTATVSSSSDPSWVTLEADSGEANGSPTLLKYIIPGYTTSTTDCRTATITVTVGNLKKEVKITQYPGKAIEFENVKEMYTGSGLYNFTIKAQCPWVAEVLDKPDNGGVIEQLRTSGGVANWDGSDFVFSILAGIATPMIRFKPIPIDGEFEYYDLPLTVKAPYDLGGLWVYPVDQLTGEKWYTYANVPLEEDDGSVPPDGPQNPSPEANSCAAISLDKSWRLPTLTELIGIYKAVDDSGGAAQYGFNTSLPSRYWTATTHASKPFDKAHFVNFDSYGQSGFASKIYSTVLARCVRDK